jgi:hypothetical protein
MKHIGVMLIPFCLLAGCTTIKGGRDLASASPVSVVSVISNYDINWDGEGPTMEKNLASNTGAFVKKALNIKSNEERVRISKADGLINEADGIFRSIAVNSGIADFKEKDAVINARAYGEARINSRQDNDDNVKADGYRYVYSRDKNFPANLSQEIGSGSCVYVTFQFTKILASGIAKSGTCRAKVGMTVLIIDASGKTLYNRSHTVTSSEKTAVLGGAYDEAELMQLFSSAISDVCYEFVAQFKSTKW